MESDSSPGSTREGPRNWGPELEVDGPGRTEHHEAGHTVMAMACGFEVRAITLVAAPNSNGSTLINLPAYPTEVDHIKLALLGVSSFSVQ